MFVQTHGEYPEPQQPWSLCVCGGRDYFDRDWIFHCLDAVYRKHKFTDLVQGGAPGADTLAWKWCQSRGVIGVVYKANWKELGPAAGPERNARMVRHGLKALVAFPGGPGTANMIAQCRDAGVPVWEPGLRRLKE